jgi:TetR/AcrR family transcriptional repressor of nem operon
MEGLLTKKSENTRDRILKAAESLIMAKGFAGTSIDDILKSAGLTKGAFFHHFKGKADLARELVEWHARKDLEMFGSFSAQAEAQSDDPLEQIFIFLKTFENVVSNMDDPTPGCMYAVYTYESMQFEPSIRDFVADVLRQWTLIYVRKFQEVLDRYKPALPVTARQLAEMIVAIIEGGLVLQRAYGEARLTARQSEQFRNYLKLLFKSGEQKAGRKLARRKGERRAPHKEYA